MLLPSVVAFVLQTAFIVGGGLLTLVSLEASLILLTALFLALIWPVSRLVKNRPEEYGQYPDGVEPALAPSGQTVQSASSETLLPDYQWREALQTRAFWLMAAAGCGQGVVTFGMFFSPVLAFDSGFAAGHASGLAISSSVIAVPFVLVGGVLGDRLPIRWVMFAFAILGSVSVGMLSFATTLPTFYLFIGRAVGHRFRRLGAAHSRRAGGLFRTPKLRHDHRHVLVDLVHAATGSGYPDRFGVGI